MVYLSVFGIKLGSCLLVYILSIWRLAPLGLAGYQQWNVLQNKKDLALTVTCTLFSLCSFFFIGVALVNVAYHSDEILSYAYGLPRFIVILGLTFLISYFSVPKTIELFRVWKITREMKYFSRVALLGTFSFYAFLIILTLILPNKISF